MASKNTGPKTVSKRVSIVWVKRANMWCKTYFEGFKQIQEWSSDKPS